MDKKPISFADAQAAVERLKKAADSNMLRIEVSRSDLVDALFESRDVYVARELHFLDDASRILEQHYKDKQPNSGCSTAEWMLSVLSSLIPEEPPRATQDFGRVGHREFRKSR